MKQILKPCPFCGSIPEIDTKDWKYFESPYEPILIIRQRVKITCRRCFLVKDIVASEKADCSISQKELRVITKEIARKTIDNFWNKRA